MPVPANNLQYSITFTATDALSTDPFELGFEVYTEAAAAGTLLYLGSCTSGVAVTTPTFADPGLLIGSNVRYLRVRDGAGNWTETAFSVQVVAAPLTDEEIEDALSDAPVIHFIFEQRDNQFQFLADLSEAVQTASVALDNERAILRIGKLQIDPNFLPDGFDANSSNIAVNGVISIGTAERIFTIALLRLDVADEELSPLGEALWHADGADLTVLLQQARIEDPYYLPAGSAIIATVRALCESEGLEHDFPDDTNVTPIAKSWPVNTSKLEIANELLDAINWFGVYSTPRGVQISREKLNPEDEVPAVIYTTVQEPRMIVPPFRRRKNRGRFANRVTMRINDPLRPLEFVTIEDTDPNSPNSTANSALSAIEVNSALAIDEDMIRAIAEYKVRDSAAHAVEGVLLTEFDPRRVGHETYLLHIEDQEDGTPWRVRGWQLNMQNGAIMQHTIGRVRIISTTEVV